MELLIMGAVLMALAFHSYVKAFVYGSSHIVLVGAVESVLGILLLALSTYKQEYLSIPMDSEYWIGLIHGAMISGFAVMWYSGARWWLQHQPMNRKNTSILWR